MGTESRREKVRGLLLALPVVIFIAWPVFEVLVKSFFPDGTFSFTVYQKLFAEKTGLLCDSVVCASLSTTLTVVFAVNIAVYIAFCSAWFKRFILGALMLTMISPPFISSLAYIILFGKRGLITYHLLRISWNPYGMHGVVLMEVLGNISLATLLILGMFSVIDSRLLDASRDLGGKPWRTFRRIILPLSVPGIVVAGFIVFIKCLSDFGTPIIIGGRFTLLATEAYLEVIGRGNLDIAAGMSALIFIPSLLAFFFYRHFVNQQHGDSVAFQRIGKNGLSGFTMGPLITRLLAFVTWAFLLIMLLQYAVIFLGTIFDYRHGDFVFTMEHIQAVRFGKMASFLRSCKYAFIAAVGVSLFGAVLTYYLERHKGFYSRVIDFLATLPYIMPGPFFGIGYILAFNDGPLVLTGTGIIVVLNCMFRQLPVSTKAVSAGLSRISHETEDAAADLGSGRFRLIFQVIIPLLKPAMVVSFINTFTATMTTVGAIIFIVSPVSKVATVELFNVLRDGDYGLASVLASMIIIVTLVVNLSFAGWAMSRGQRA
ncbi:iron ABC transporter permease [Maridesulfovibrio sp.]|uniref:ABC transporter permease n=1 Tax=Maridesulfovibrio sp. TaxID=2795000 RepID=UPI002A18D9E3|nr:iron ABC transporter permease [Maridesulfovibrio sp.]